MDLALREGYYNLTIFHEATNSIQQASSSLSDCEEILIDPEGSLSCPNAPVTVTSHQPDDSRSHLHPCLLRLYPVLVERPWKFSRE